MQQISADFHSGILLRIYPRKYALVEAEVSSAIGIITIAFRLLIVLAEFLFVLCVLFVRLGIIFVVSFNGCSGGSCAMY